eukprot:TRINITY_DN1854_c1_g3_i2.p2 TRINITY_DN1854_c1_g3~~TRINITY_DN1854_c1_g3_i2.p2  ORF type:complete len:572 (+),score=243.88 TRINITY_DN1854_c1_g3_i2:71-1717(+)
MLHAQDPDALNQKGQDAVRAIREQVEAVSAAADAFASGPAPTSAAEWAAETGKLKQHLISAHSGVSGKLSDLQAWAKKHEEERSQAERWNVQLSQQREQWTEEIASLEQRERDAAGLAEQLQQQREEKEREAAAAEAQAEHHRALGGSASEPSDCGGRYLCFLTQRAELLVDCEAAAVRFDALEAAGGTGAPGADPKAWGDAALGELCDEAADFEDRLTEREQELARLTALALPLQQDPAAAGWDTSLSEAQSAFESAREAFCRWNRKLQQERRRRDDYERNIDDFMANQRKLVEWCAEQRKKLDAHLQGEGTPADVRKNVYEFCQSLQSRIPFMEENFAVLAGMGEDLVPGPKARIVEHALVDATSEWLKLQVFAYEKMRDTLLAEHKDSGLKEECTAFSNWAGQRVKSFLDNAEELLRTPVDDDSKTIVRPALDTCKSLQHDFPPHQLIVDHLSDFEVRMDLIHDHYEKLKRTMLSRLTFLCLKLGAFHSTFKGKDEYEERMMNISSWVETKDSNVVAWEEVAARLEEVKKVIEKEAEVDIAFGDM